MSSRPIFRWSTNPFRLRKLINSLWFKRYGLKAKMCISLVEKAEIPYFEKSNFLTKKREQFSWALGLCFEGQGIH